MDKYKYALDNIVGADYSGDYPQESEDLLQELVEFKKYFDELYGCGYEIANFHLNGDLEPFDNFYDNAIDWGEEE